MSFKRDYIYCMVDAQNVINKTAGQKPVDKITLVTSVGKIVGKLLERKEVIKIEPGTSEEEHKEKISKIIEQYGGITVFDVTKMMVIDIRTDGEFNAQAECIELVEAEVYNMQGAVILSTNSMVVFADQVIGFIPTA